MGSGNRCEVSGARTGHKKCGAVRRRGGDQLFGQGPSTPGDYPLRTLTQVPRPAAGPPPHPSGHPRMACRQPAGKPPPPAASQAALAAVCRRTLALSHAYMPIISPAWHPSTPSSPAPSCCHRRCQHASQLLHFASHRSCPRRRASCCRTTATAWAPSWDSSSACLGCWRRRRQRWQRWSLRAAASILPLWTRSAHTL